MGVLSTFAVGAGLLGLATAQFPPKPYGITTVQSNLQPGISISYKEVGNPARPIPA